MAELVVRFDLKFDNRVLRLGLVGLALLAMAPELASESVNLTTYYPAPSGVYTNLTVTGNTFLARDSGGVAIGTASNPGANIMLMVTDPSGAGNTRVGIGTINPAGGYMLDVAGSTLIEQSAEIDNGLTTKGIAYTNYGGSAEIYVNGDNHPGGGIAVSDDGGFFDYNDGFITYNGSTGIRVAGNNGLASGGGAGGASWGNGGNLYVNGSIGVGPGGDPYHSGASIDAGGVIVAREGCSPVTYDPAVAGSETCPGGKYVTNASGFYAQFYALGNGIDVAVNAVGGSVGSAQGTMLCCNCPPGGCNAF